jgi:long-subunit fatty acid transport protein
MRTSILNLRIFLAPPELPLRALGGLWLFFVSTACFGESTNKRMIMPGSRAQALGGAFTAVADDASAGWYNPAGLGFLKGPGVSATVNNFSTAKKTISEVVSAQDLTESSASIYPGFAGANTNLGPFAVGWSYFSLEQQNTDESQTIAAQESTSLAAHTFHRSITSSTFQYDRTELTSGSLIHTGVSFALNMGKHVSLGLSEFYYRRQKQTNVKERSTYQSGVFYDGFSRLSTKNEGTLTVAGLLLKGSELSAGVSVRIPRALSDQTTLATSSIIHTGTSPELNTDQLLTHREDELTVRTWNLGLAWTPVDYALVTADAVYYAPTKTPWANNGGFDTRAVTDWSFGVELRAKSLLISGGAFSNSSLVGKPQPAVNTTAPAQINYMGFSAAVGLRNGRSENLFIMVRQWGQGQKQMIQGDLSLQQIDIDMQTFSLATSYKL